MDVVGEYFHLAISILHSFSPSSDVCNVYYLFTQVVSMIILCSVCDGGYSFSKGWLTAATPASVRVLFYSIRNGEICRFQEGTAHVAISHNDWFQTDVYSIYRMKPHTTNNDGENRHISIPHTKIAAFSHRRSVGRWTECCTFALIFLTEINTFVRFIRIAFHRIHSNQWENGSMETSEICSRDIPAATVVVNAFIFNVNKMWELIKLLFISLMNGTEVNGRAVQRLSHTIMCQLKMYIYDRQALGPHANWPTNRPNQSKLIYQAFSASFCLHGTQTNSVTTSHTNNARAKWKKVMNFSSGRPEKCVEYAERENLKLN